jgi:TetR/AcrR family fatty acid metabolism transcriptional regulator
VAPRVPGTRAPRGDEQRGLGRTSREDKRRRIIDAAVEVFADKGFFGARVSEIADTAGVADGTIYLYFESKDDILISLFREKMAEILHRLTSIIDIEATPEGKLRRYISEHLALVAEQPKLMQVLTVELRQSPRFMKEFSHRSFARYLALLAGIIEEGQRRGVFAGALQPTLMARAIFGAIDEISLSWVLSGGVDPSRLDRHEVVAEICSLVLSGLSRSETRTERTE